MDEQQQAQQPQQPTEQPAKPKNDGMGWYKFLIYFGLFAGALWNLIYGIFYLSGYVYTMADGSADLVYLVFPNLHTVDVLFGVACIALAAYGIVVRFLLAKYKKCSLVCLYLLYALVIIIEIIYLVVAANIIDASIADVMDAQSIASLIWQFAFLIISIVYFSKRKDMFVH